MQIDLQPARCEDARLQLSTRAKVVVGEDSVAARARLRHRDVDVEVAAHDRDQAATERRHGKIATWDLSRVTLIVDSDACEYGFEYYWERRFYSVALGYVA